LNAATVTRETPAPVAGTVPRLERALSTTEVILFLAYFAGRRRLIRLVPTMMLPVTGPPHLLRGDLFAGVHEPASGRRSLRIDGGDVLLPDIIHGAVHRTHREFFEVKQQVLIER
jgi:hypothetical protein